MNTWILFGREKEEFLGLDADKDGVIELKSELQTPSDGIAIRDSSKTPGLGWVVSSAGDLNGDGISDFAVAAPFSSPGGQLDGATPGKAWVIFGQAGQREIIVPETLEAEQGFSIDLRKTGAENENFVNSAGDFNGDGLDDLLVFVQNEESEEAWVIFGRTDNDFADKSTGQDGIVRAHLDYEGLTEERGFIVRSAHRNDVTVASRFVSGLEMSMATGLTILAFALQEPLRTLAVRIRR